LVARRAASLGGRAVLIRRPGGHVPRLGEPRPYRHWGFVDARPGRERSWWGTFTDEAELLDVPLDPPPGPGTAEPAYLVCTQGRHDACCAISGRPVAAALADAYPEHTWECSHIGGCRFAANLVLLPHGLVYAWTTPRSALELVAAYHRGRVGTDGLRGRSSLASPVQAAQQEARRKLGLLEVDALAPLAVEQQGPLRWLVRLDHVEGAPLTVQVDAAWTDPEYLTCRATQPRRARVFTATLIEP
jgi:Sucrase/ferredoxin-like